jgi:RNA polymerase sigma-70 factor (ECF subfamily)
VADEVDATMVAGRRRSRLRRPRSDAVLARAALGGDTDAVGELFARHWDTAYRAAYWIVHDAAMAEDIAQEAFLAAVGALDRFDRRRPFAPWLRRVAVNRAIDHSRARSLRREVGVDALVSRAAPTVAPADPELLAALGDLPLEQRVVVVMRHVLGCTPGEIAATLDVPRGTVNSRLRRGLDALAEVLGER